MHKLTKLLAFALAAMTAASAHAQVTGTSLPNKLTLTSGNYTTTGTFVYTDAVGVGVAKVTVPNLIDLAGWGPLDTGVLNGLSLTGGLVSTTAQVRGLLTTSGVTSVTGSLTTLTASGIGTFGGLISTSATINGNASVSGSLTATGGLSVYNDGYYARNAAAVKLSVGTSGNPFITMNSTSITSYQSMFSGAGIGFGSGSTTNVGLFSPSAGILKVSDASTGIGVLQTGGFASNFRAITTTGNLTVTDSVVTTTTNVTVSLPSTSITGQQFIVKNIGSASVTVAVVGGVKTIDGATTQAIISGAGKSSAMTFTYDGTNYIISQ